MDLLSRLQAEFGDAVPTTLAGKNDAVDDVMPQAVAAPRDEEVAQALVHWCGRENVAFVPRGGGSKLHIGAPPSRCDLVIHTSLLNTVVDHDEGNATLQAGAGITLIGLYELLFIEKQCKQFVPLADDLDEFSTLGGVVASNHYDDYKLKYGAPRDLVTGLHAVLSDGRLVKAGSKVVKNVSGYDLNKVFIGSFGTLGLITEVTIRLRPEPSAAADWFFAFDSWQEAEHQAWQIINGAFEPATLWVLCDSEGIRLSVSFEGSETSVKKQRSLLPASNCEVEFAPLAKLYPPHRPHYEDAWILRAHLPLQTASQWARFAKDNGADKVIWQCALGMVHAIAHAALDVPLLRNAAEKLGGFLIVEHAPVEVKTPDLVWGAPRGDFALMKKLKQSFDAANVCAPGRFVGGI